MSQLIGIQILRGRGRTVEQVGDGKAEAGLIGMGGMQRIGGHVVETGLIQAGDEQGVALILSERLHRGDLPQVHLQLAGDLASLALDRLTQGQGDAGGGLGHIFTQHQHGVCLFHVAQAGGTYPALVQDVQHLLQAGPFALLDACVEVVGAHQLAQGEVALERGARRADTDDAGGGAQGIGGAVEGTIHRDG